MSTVTKMSITLDNTLVQELNSVAKELNEKKSHLIEEPLHYCFDVLDTRLAEKRLDALATGEVSAVKADDVWKELGL